MSPHRVFQNIQASKPNQTLKNHHTRIEIAQLLLLNYQHGNLQQLIARPKELGVVCTFPQHTHG
jgi:hypothetical protein